MAKNHISTHSLAATLLYIAMLLAAASCDHFDYHPYDVKIHGQKNVNATNAARIEQLCAGKDTLRFVATGDTQGWYDETTDMVKSINALDGVDFVVHTGDLTDYGATREFEWQRDILNKLRVPYVCNIGNHDCLGTGKDAFRRIYGETNISFIAGRIKFIFLNTNALEYDYSEAIPNLDYIDEQAHEDSASFDRTIVSMHAHPYADVFNDNVARVFEALINRLPGIMFCINGHDHTMLHTTYFDDGLVYYQTACAQKRCYYLFTITPSGYNYEIINF